MRCVGEVCVGQLLCVWMYTRSDALCASCTPYTVCKIVVPISHITINFSCSMNGTCLSSRSCFAQSASSVRRYSHI